MEGDGLQIGHGGRPNELFEEVRHVEIVRIVENDRPSWPARLAARGLPTARPLRLGGDLDRFGGHLGQVDLFDVLRRWFNRSSYRLAPRPWASPLENRPDHRHPRPLTPRL